MVASSVSSAARISSGPAPPVSGSPALPPLPPLPPLDVPAVLAFPATLAEPADSEELPAVSVAAEPLTPTKSSCGDETLPQALATNAATPHQHHSAPQSIRAMLAVSLRPSPALHRMSDGYPERECRASGASSDQRTRAALMTEICRGIEGPRVPTTNPCRELRDARVGRVR